MANLTENQSKSVVGLQRLARHSITREGETPLDSRRDADATFHHGLMQASYESTNYMTSESQQMIEHIVRLIRKPSITVDENTPLVSSGLIDSMELVDLLLKLEDLTHMRIPAGKVQAKDMDTVAKMFATAQRAGKPRK
jgi:acyl carrier protein